MSDNEAGRDAGDIEALLRVWLPASCVRVAPVGDYPMTPEEAALVAAAPPRRRAEFGAGRFLARAGLRRLGAAEAPIGIGPLGQPLWPAGVTGAISHDGDLCAVALMRAADAPFGLGVDLARLGRPASEIAEIAPLFVVNPEERAVASAFGLPEPPELLLFALKEALVKTLSPRLGALIDPLSIWIGTDGAFYEGTRLPLTLHAGVTRRYLVAAAAPARVTLAASPAAGAR